MPPEPTTEPATRKRGNPLFPLLSRVYDFWTDRFRHDPKVMTPSGKGRNIAAFTTAIKAQVLEANPNGVTARDFKQAVEHLKARLDPDTWQAELEKAAGRIEAAILAYADSGYHRKQAERQAASPYRHFDNWLHVSLTTWIDAARTKGTINGDGVAKHVKRRDQRSGIGEPINVEALLGTLDGQLAKGSSSSLTRFRKLMVPAGTKRAREHRQREAALLAPYLAESFPESLKSDLFRLADLRAHEAWNRPVERTEGRWKHQLALILEEALKTGATDA